MAIPNNEVVIPCDPFTSLKAPIGYVDGNLYVIRTW